MRINVVEGDVTQVRVDALITALNSSGMWFGGIDGVIERVAGHQYHDVAAHKLRGNPDTDVIVANPDHSHHGGFQNVVFVIDDLIEPLSLLVLRGLAAASDRGFTTVSMPMIRCGVMAGIVGTIEETVADIAKAVRAQATDATNKIEQLSIVVYQDPRMASLMRNALQ